MLSQRYAWLPFRQPRPLRPALPDVYKRQQLDGVNVDIENVTETEKDAYTRLVAALRQRIPREKEVSVAVAANPKGWTTGWHGSYDYKSLAEYADYLMIMAYDESWNGSSEGPVASYNFVERSIQYARRYVPAEKIVLGVPFYGRIWSSDGNLKGHGISLDVLSRMLPDYNATITYDETYQSPKAEFTVKQGDKEYIVNGKALAPGRYTVWFEDERSPVSYTHLIRGTATKDTSFTISLCDPLHPRFR